MTNRIEYENLVCNQVRKSNQINKFDNQVRSFNLIGKK